MGINKHNRRFLNYCMKSGVDFQNTLQVGRQNCLFIDKKIGIEYYGYAEPLFHFLGAKTVDSLDYDDFEQATIIHDMNLPITENLIEKYSVVMDGGTLEHVFNYPVAIKNCMEMVKIGGHFISITPGNNWFGHGFYQFSPDLFFSLLSEQNGFDETHVFMTNDYSQWFEVRSPKEINCFADFPRGRNKPALLFVVSKKISSTPKELKALQSHYVNAWKNNSSEKKKSNNKILSFVKKFIPKKILLFIYDVKLFFRRLNKSFFYKKVKI